MRTRFRIAALAISSVFLLSGCSELYEDPRPVEVPFMSLAKSDFVITESDGLTDSEILELDTKDPQLAYSNGYHITYATPAITKVDDTTSHVRVAMDYNFPMSCGSEEFGAMYREYHELPKKGRQAREESDMEPAPTCALATFISSPLENWLGGEKGTKAMSTIEFNHQRGRSVFEYDAPSNDQHIFSTLGAMGISGSHKVNLGTGQLVKGSNLKIEDGGFMSPEETAKLHSLSPQYKNGKHSLTVGSPTITTTADGQALISIPVDSNMPVSCADRTDERECFSPALSVDSETNGFSQRRTDFARTLKGSGTSVLQAIVPSADGAQLQGALVNMSDPHKPYDVFTIDVMTGKLVSDSPVGE